MKKREAAAPAPEQKKPRHLLRKAICAVLVLILLLAAAGFVIPLTETIPAKNRTAEGSADWMSRLDDGLRLNEIVLPGTHDSATQYVHLAFFSKCQALTVGQQLEAGYRYLDIRLELADDGLKLMHGFTSCLTEPMPWSDELSLDEVLNQCCAFLEAHPTETVLFAVKQEHGSATVTAFENALYDAAANRPERWLLTDTIPTLGQARGRLVLLRRYEDEAGLGADAGIPLLWPDQGGNDDVSRNVEQTDNGSCALWVQDRYCYGTEDKWAAFYEGLSAQAEAGTGSAAWIHFLSTKGTLPYGHPRSFSGALNTRLEKLAAKHLAGWIVVDFGDAPLAKHIYEANFG